MNKNKYVYVKVNIINLRKHMGSPPFFSGLWHIANFCSFLFCVFCFVCRRIVWLLRTQCCQRLWIVHFWSPLLFSLMLCTDFQYNYTPVICRHLGKWIGSLSRVMHSSATINKFFVRPSHILHVPNTLSCKRTTVPFFIS
jgi:hypothetical protein